MYIKQIQNSVYSSKLENILLNDRRHTNILHYINIMRKHIKLNTIKNRRKRYLYVTKIVF